MLIGRVNYVNAVGEVCRCSGWAWVGKICGGSVSGWVKWEGKSCVCCW